MIIKEYTQQIDNIAEWIKTTCTRRSWHKARVDAVLVSDEVLSYHAAYQAAYATHFKALRFSFTEGGVLETMLLDLYHIMHRDKNNSAWNKMRFIYDRDEERPFAAYRWDPDYAWLLSLDEESEEYRALDGRLEQQILSWEGIPQNLPRPWRETRITNIGRTGAIDASLSKEHRYQGQH